MASVITQARVRQSVNLDEMTRQGANLVALTEYPNVDEQGNIDRTIESKSYDRYAVVEIEGVEFTRTTENSVEELVKQMLYWFDVNQILLDKGFKFQGKLSVTKDVDLNTFVDVKFIATHLNPSIMVVTPFKANGTDYLTNQKVDSKLFEQFIITAPTGEEIKFASTELTSLFSMLEVFKNLI